MNNPFDIIKHAWSLFGSDSYSGYNNYSSGSNQTRSRFSRGNERTVVTSVYNRLAMDVATIDIKHVKLDEEGRYIDDYPSKLNNCLTVEANIDQSARAFLQDVVVSLMDEGCVAIVPVETTVDIKDNTAFDIDSLRTGRIVEWFPKHVKVRLYNENTGMHEDVMLPKKNVAIIENPLYAVINEPNSTMQRLIRKLNMLDDVDAESSSGKLDLIIQLPYAVKTEIQKTKADDRRRQVEEQLKGSRYGIAYIDGTEHVTQLNRSLENNLMKQVEYLTNLLYSQLGITQGILDGTADETTMTNYYSRTTEPIIAAIVDEMHRKFLTKTARTQRQAIKYFRDPFKLVPVTMIPDIADKLTRNEITSSNEIRSIIGLKPSSDPKADELRNKNLNESKQAPSPQNEVEEPTKSETDNKK